MTVLRLYEREGRPEPGPAGGMFAGRGSGGGAEAT